jgi:hypothetical protein
VLEPVEAYAVGHGQLDHPPFVVAVAEARTGPRQAEVGGVEVRRDELRGDRRLRDEAERVVVDVGDLERRAR